MDLVNSDDDDADCRIRASQAVGDALDAAYEEPIAIWMLGHGCVLMDMDPEQVERFAAWERGDHDVMTAARLICARRTYGARAGR